MSASKLSLFNGALLILGERAIASLSENREPRRLLDRVWDGGAVDFCLNSGQWKFAKRSLQMAPEIDVEPNFGYTYAYTIPDDHIRTTSLCSDESGNSPLTQYSMEQGYIFANISPIYLSYVSNDVNYGNDLSLWPQDFIKYVEAFLASEICEKLTQSESKWKKVYELMKLRLREAANGDAMEGATTFPPIGSWLSSRLGRGARRDRGSRGQLIG